MGCSQVSICLRLTISESWMELCVCQALPLSGSLFLPLPRPLPNPYPVLVLTLSHINKIFGKKSPPTQNKTKTNMNVGYLFISTLWKL